MFFIILCDVYRHLCSGYLVLNVSPQSRLCFLKKKYFFSKKKKIETLTVSAMLRTKFVCNKTAGKPAPHQV